MQPQQHAGKRIHYSRLVVYDIKMFDTEFKKNLLDIISVPKAAYRIQYLLCPTFTCKLKFIIKETTAGMCAAACNS